MAGRGGVGQRADGWGEGGGLDSDTLTRQATEKNKAGLRPRCGPERPAADVSNRPPNIKPRIVRIGTRVGHYPLTHHSAALLLPAHPPSTSPKLKPGRGLLLKMKYYAGC